MRPGESSFAARLRIGRRVFAIVLVATLCRDPAPARAASDRGAPVPYELITRSASLDARARADAVAALATQGTPAAHNLLVVMLQRDVDPSVRTAAAAALGASHDAGVADALDYAARADSDADVRAAAAAAHAMVVPFGRRPKLAAGLSVLCPGCGHFYLRRPGVALGFLASTAALIAAGVAVQNDTPFEDPGRATPLKGSNSSAACWTNPASHSGTLRPDCRRDAYSSTCRIRCRIARWE